MSRRFGKQADLWAQIGIYTGLGFIIPASAVGGYVLGWLLDEWLGTKPVLGVILGFLGAAGGVVEILRILTREEKRASRDDSNNRPGGSDPR